MKQVALIGVGFMGHGIALNLLKKNFHLNLFEHTGNQPLDDLQQLGAKVESNLKILVSGCEAVILCVTGAKQVEDLMLGSGGLAHILHPGTLVIDCSTSIPSLSRKIAEDLSAKQIGFVDAPMTRTPKEAALGKLNLLVGGSIEDFQRSLPILSTFAENITHIGPVGHGHTVKLLHNYVSLGSAMLLIEALACAKHQDLDLSTFCKVLNQGGGRGVALDRISPYILSADDSALQFSLNNVLKDLSYYHQMACESHSFHAIALALKTMIETIITDKNGQEFLPHLFDYLPRGQDQ
ncbi:MAG: NAD(P)-dependent oxidoreductase [Gammaproteobacteria bacterium]|nr:NAD(P)-dependent oxidoreductase [Gammaproteobacteria bacterium]